MATSKAMGTGRNAATRATRRMPPIVACAISAWGGRSSMTSAPRMAARIINGKATRKTYQKLFAKERAVETSACVQVSEAGISMGQATAGGGGRLREDSGGGKTKKRERKGGRLGRAARGRKKP